MVTVPAQLATILTPAAFADALATAAKDINLRIPASQLSRLEAAFSPAFMATSSPS